MGCIELRSAVPAGSDSCRYPQRFRFFAEALDEIESYEPALMGGADFERELGAVDARRRVGKPPEIAEQLKPVGGSGRKNTLSGRLYLGCHLA